MIKLSKKLTKYLILGTSSPNTSKSEISAKIRLTDWGSERWADNIDFIGPSVYKFSIHNWNLTISVIWIYFPCIPLNWSGHAQSCQTNPSWFLTHLQKNHLLNSSDYWDIEISVILRNLVSRDLFGQ